MGLCGWLSQFGALLSPPWPLFIWVLRIFVWGFEYVPNWLYLFDFTCLKLKKSRMGLCGWLSQFGAMLSPLWPLVGPHLLMVEASTDVISHNQIIKMYPGISKSVILYHLHDAKIFGAMLSPLWPLVGPHLLFGGSQYWCHLKQPCFFLSDHKNVPRHIKKCHIISPVWCKNTFPGRMFGDLDVVKEKAHFDCLLSEWALQLSSELVGWGPGPAQN